MYHNTLQTKMPRIGWGPTVQLQEDFLVACTDLHLPIFVQKPNEIRIEESV